MDLLIDVGGGGIEIAQRIDERHPVLAEIVEIVFDLGRPIVPERPFDAGARGPADPGLLAGEVKGRGNAQSKGVGTLRIPKQLRTVQRVVKAWRAKSAWLLIEGAAVTITPTHAAFPPGRQHPPPRCRFGSSREAI